MNLGDGSTPTTGSTTTSTTAPTRRSIMTTTTTTLLDHSPCETYGSRRNGGEVTIVFKTFVPQCTLCIYVFYTRFVFCFLGDAFDVSPGCTYLGDIRTYVSKMLLPQPIFGIAAGSEFSYSLQ
jgi:hypothetical protein